MANKYLDLAGLKSYNGALLGTQIGEFVTYTAAVDETPAKFEKTSFSYNASTGVVTKSVTDAISIDTTVTSNSGNLVTSGAVRT